MADSTPMSTVEMTFYSSFTTPLFSMTWSPKNNGSYAGTCIFLILLAIIFRVLMAGKTLLERRWRDQQQERHLIRVRGSSSEAERIDSDNDSRQALLVGPRGVEKDVMVVTNRARPLMPFRLSVDLPRAGYVTVMAGVGYLLMLAVMTFNVGYFFAVLAGIFLGELAVGRFIQPGEH